MSDDLILSVALRSQRRSNVAPLASNRGGEFPVCGEVLLQFTRKLCFQGHQHGLFQRAVSKAAWSSTVYANGVQFGETGRSATDRMRSA